MNAPTFHEKMETILLFLFNVLGVFSEPGAILFERQLLAAWLSTEQIVVVARLFANQKHDFGLFLAFCHSNPSPKPKRQSNISNSMRPDACIETQCVKTPPRGMETKYCSETLGGWEWETCPERQNIPEFYPAYTGHSNGKNRGFSNSFLAPASAKTAGRSIPHTWRVE
jgi:hypothetical protein